MRKIVCKIIIPAQFFFSRQITLFCSRFSHLTIFFLSVFRKPFKRMQYVEAIAWLKEHGYKKEDGTYYEEGEDIPEAPERFMTDKLNEPVMLHR